MMRKKLLWSRAAKIVERFSRDKPANARDLQLRAETLLLYALATRSTPISINYSKDVISQSAELIASGSSEIPSYDEQIRVVKKFLGHSVLKTLRTTANIIEAVENDEANDRFTDEVERQTKLKFGFVPVLRKSVIPGAGTGLHIDGSAEAGSLLALYPGACYMPSDLRYLPDYPQITKNNEYMIWRYDGIVIDGKAAVDNDEAGDDGNTEEVDSSSGSNSAVNVPSFREEQMECTMHSFSHGHMVNHPMQGGSPNCIQFMFDMHVSRELQELRHLVPNALHSTAKRSIFERLLNLTIRQRVPSVSSLTSASFSSTRIPTLLLIALRDIQDEEVFMNYRFNPNAPNIPHWYHDCDPESSSRRWNETGILFS